METKRLALHATDLTTASSSSLSTAAAADGCDGDAKAFYKV